MVSGTERYWRVPLTFDGVDYIVGVEIRDEDRSDTIVTDLQIILKLSANRCATPVAAAEWLSGEISSEFPGRFYFIEVGRDDEYWVQIFYPPTTLRKVEHADS